MQQQGPEHHNDRDKKIRVQLDFTRNALDTLDELKARIGAPTRADTIRRALRLFWWFVNEIEPDDTITVTNKDKEIVSKFKASLLELDTTEHRRQDII